MNRDNLLKLRAALEGLPPKQFDYRSTNPNCGCVIPVMEKIFDEDEDTALDLTTAEMDYLTGFKDLRPVESRDSHARCFKIMSDAEATGATGIAEAIRRIDVLLALRGGERMTNKEIQAQLMREVSPSATLEPPQFADQVADRVITRLTTGGEYLTRVIRERDDARRLIGSEQSARAQAEADRREVQSATARRIEDLRVSLIRAINTTLSRAGVELPTSAAATVEPVPPKYPTEAERLQADSLDRLSKLARAPEVSAASTAEPSVTGEVPWSFRLMVERDEARAEVARVLSEIRYLTYERDELRRGSSNLITERDEARAELETAEKALAEARALTAAEKTRADQNYADWKNVRAAIKALEDWPADVRDEALKELATWRSSHWAAVMRENEDLKRQLAEAAKWRPMAELPKDGPVLLRTEPGFFAWRLNPALSKTFQRDSEYLGWLPIPPYRAKEGQ